MLLLIAIFISAVIRFMQLIATERYIERRIGVTHENFIVQYFKLVELIKFGLAETVPLKIAIFASLTFLS